MMKQIYQRSLITSTLLTTVMILLFSSLTANAQCLPDCRQSPWGPPQTRNIILFHECFGCAIEVTFVTRRACGAFDDMQITEVELVSGCGGCTLQEVFEAAFEALIMDEPRIFEDPDNGECANNWRISSAGCFNEWFVTFPEGGSGTFLVPCDGETCCLTPLRVCRDNNGNIESITPLGGPFGGGDCAQSTPVFGEGPCFTTCEFDGFTLGKGSLPGGRVTNDPAHAIEHAIAMPNPATGTTVEFELDVNAAGQAHLAIYDMQGRIVKETSVSLANGKARVAVDVADLTPGSYVYELTVAGRKLVNDKLVISK